MNATTKQSLDEILKIVSYDPEAGEFRWLQQSARRCRVGAKAGTVSNGRAFITIKNVKYGVPRLAWFVMTGSMPSGDIDHIDGDPLNNKFSNLRDVSREVNSQNVRSPRAHNRIGLLGVRPDKSKFTARIGISGKSIHLGTFATAEEAHKAYVQAKRRYHQGCTI